jgi:S1-C subfamily serine protease
MGRPLSKDVNGVKVVGTLVNNAGIRVIGRFDGTTNTDYRILKQRGARAYLVTRNAATVKVGILVNAINNTLASGQILMQGKTEGLNSSNVSIAKLTKRIATDFDGRRYTWFLEQDLEGTFIKLKLV